MSTIDRVGYILNTAISIGAGIALMFKNYPLSLLLALTSINFAVWMSKGA